MSLLRLLFCSQRPLPIVLGLDIELSYLLGFFLTGSLFGWTPLLKSSSCFLVIFPSLYRAPIFPNCLRLTEGIQAPPMD
jgi:hypothetical protein